MYILSLFLKKIKSGHSRKVFICWDKNWTIIALIITEPFKLFCIKKIQNLMNSYSDSTNKHIQILLYSSAECFVYVSAGDICLYKHDFKKCQIHECFAKNCSSYVLRNTNSEFALIFNLSQIVMFVL